VHAELYFMVVSVCISSLYMVDFMRIMSKARGFDTVICNQRSVIGGQQADDRRRTTDDGRRTTDDGRRRAEGGGQ